MRSNSVLPGWSIVENGWWCNEAITLAVCKEKDGWHSYIKDGETPSNTPVFQTMVEAMRDAEKRGAAKTTQLARRAGR